MRVMHAKGVIRPTWRALQILTLTSILLCVGIVYTATWGNRVLVPAYLPASIPKVGEWGHGVKSSTSGEEDLDVGEEVAEGHPIEHLMKKAQHMFEPILKEEAASLSDAAQKYRARRGRHPPPGFDAWYNYATEKGALVVESFFDPVYEDLAPFWGINAYQLRRTVYAFSSKISIRDGEVDSDKKNSYEKLRQVMKIVKSLAKHPHVALPDMDIPLSMHDEPTMLVPWEEVDTALSSARQILAPPKEVDREFMPFNESKAVNWTFDAEWLDARPRKPGKIWLGPRPLWSLVQPACPPDSPASSEKLFVDIWDPEGHTKPEHSASGLLPLEMPKRTLAGYVKKWKWATDACNFPNLQGLHGVFVNPNAMALTQKLFPLFSSAKLSMSSEVLMPSVQEWNATEYEPSMSIPWSKKQAKLFWRGPVQGGKSTRKNWERFHRHRFVATLNATHIEIAEVLVHAGNESTVGLGYARNFRILPANDYHLATQNGARLAAWVNSWADVAVTDLRCDEPTTPGTCDYNKKFFHVSPPPTSEEQQKYKYAASIDGNGGDNSAFIDSLKSGKLTLRASIFRQWFDSRMIPWLHFVPMDNTFIDIYGIMEYFIGTDEKEGAHEFGHALDVKIEKHEHHFNTPHWGEEKNREDTHGYSEDVVDKATHGQHVEGVHTKRDGDSNGHDKQAQKIAEAGQQWANKVLRKEDMLVYIYRLLLEYARVVDGRRQRLGWVEDLIGEERR